MNGNDLREWRKSMGYKRQADAAEALGVPARTYQRWERAERLDRILELATHALTARAQWERAREALSQFGKVMRQDH